MAFYDTDLFMINRGGTNYRVAYSQLLSGSGVNATDELMVQRGGQLYRVDYQDLGTGSIAAGDLFIVERGGKEYAAEATGFTPGVPYLGISTNVGQSGLNGIVGTVTVTNARGVNGVPPQIRNRSTNEVLYLPQNGTVTLTTTFCTANHVNMYGQFSDFTFTGSGIIGILTENYDASDWNSLVPTPVSTFGKAMFQGCENLTAIDTNIPVKNCSYFLDGCSSYNMGGTGLLNTDGVSDFRYMMRNCTSFDQPISTWKTSSARLMNSMFENCSSFDQNLAPWGPGLGLVTTFNRMFSGCSNFNQNLATWNTATAEPAEQGMDKMFQNASSFAQDLSSWCVPRFNPNNPPFNFSTGTLMTAADQPLWGQCP